MGTKSSKRYPDELKARAVQMVADLRSDTVSEWEAMGRVADLLGVGTAETVRKWVRQAEIDAGDRAGQTSEESEVLRKLRRENAELKRATVIFSRCRRVRRDQGVCVVDGVFDVASRVVRS